MLLAQLNRTRRLGCEFEMTVPQVGGGGGEDVRQVIARVLSENGLPTIARGYSHRRLPDAYDLAVEYDGSVSGESRYRGVEWHSVELKTRILCGMDEWEAIVPKALEICRYLGARVNRTTGFHVHVEMREIEDRASVIRSLYNAVHRYENVIYGLVPESRRSNHYARRLPDRAKRLHGCRRLGCFRQALEGLDRHQGMNWTHLFGGEPRVEFRYASSTLNAEKARHWARFCLRLIDHACQRTCKASARQLPNSPEGLERMLVGIGLKTNTRVYKVDPELSVTGRFLRHRWRTLNGAAS